MSSAATIVHDPSEAEPLCPALGLYLKPTWRMSIQVSLPPPRPGRAISTWEVMERLRAAAAPHAQFSALRIAKSALDFIRLEGEVDNRGAGRRALRALDGGAIRLQGFDDPLRVRAAELRPDFPSRHDWDAFFRDAPDMDEALPGERPDTLHLEGLPCRWFAPREAPAPMPGSTSCSTSSSGSTSASGPTSGSGNTSGLTPGPRVPAPGVPGGDRPSEELLRQAFGAFGEIRRVDIPMLDPYRGGESAASPSQSSSASGGVAVGGRSFHTFSFGAQLSFEAFVQYKEYAGFARAMAALRGTKLMLRGEDSKAVACAIKVSFDATKHLSDASIRRRAQERQKLRELELQREEQKRREKEAEERRRAEERKQREAEEQERARRREEKLRRREQRARAREQRRSRRRAERLQAEEQRRLRERVRVEERRLLLAQRNLQSIRLVAELLSRAEAAHRRERAQSEERRRREREAERRRQQEAELRRVEEEKRRRAGLQRRERELRQRLVTLLLARRPDPAQAGDLLRPVLLDMLRGVAARGGAGGDVQTGSDITEAGSGNDVVEPGGGDLEAGSDVANTGSDTDKPGSDPVVTGSDVTAEKEPGGAIPDHDPPRTAPTNTDSTTPGVGGRGDARTRSERKMPREVGGAEAVGGAPEQRAEERRRRPRPQPRDHGRDRKRTRRHREDRERTRSRSPRHRPAWSR